MKPKAGNTMQVKLYEQAYEALIELISGETFDVGDRLPSENDLAARFNISRPTIRRALARLQADGLVKSIQGSGNFIQARPTMHIKELVPGSGNIANMIHSFELRVVLEGETAALAAERRTETDVIHLEHILLIHAETIDRSIEETQNADLEFHNTIARACRNPLFETAIENLNNSVLSSWQLWNRIEAEEYKKIWQQVLNEHQKVFMGIKNSDANSARQAMREHLQNGRSRILKSSLSSRMAAVSAT